MEDKIQKPTWMGGKGVLGAGAGAACIAGKSLRGSTAMLKLRASERSSGFAAPAAADSRSRALLAAQPSSLPNREALLCSCVRCHTHMQARGGLESLFPTCQGVLITEPVAACQGRYKLP